MGDMDPEQLAFEHVPVHCTIGDARSLSPAPTMDTHGFELINPSPPLTPLIARDATASGAPLDLHLREIEAAVARAMGASGARSFCHVVRTARPTEQGSAPYAFQAHTDQLPAAVASPNAARSEHRTVRSVPAAKQTTPASARALLIIQAVWCHHTYRQRRLR